MEVKTKLNQLCFKLNLGVNAETCTTLFETWHRKQMRKLPFEVVSVGMSAGKFLL